MSLKKTSAFVLGFFLWNNAFAAIAPTAAASAPTIDASQILYQDRTLRGELSQGLENSEVLEALAQQGIQKSEVQLRLAAMSDQELLQVKQGYERQAGGEVVVAIGLSTLIIIALIILLLK